MTLSKYKQAVVKAIVDKEDLGLPNYTPQVQQAVGQKIQYDPTFDAFTQPMEDVKPFTLVAPLKEQQPPISNDYMFDMSQTKQQPIETQKAMPNTDFTQQVAPDQFKGTNREVKGAIDTVDEATYLFETGVNKLFTLPNQIPQIAGNVGLMLTNSSKKTIQAMKDFAPGNLKEDDEFQADMSDRLSSAEKSQGFWSDVLKYEIVKDRTQIINEKYDGKIDDFTKFTGDVSSAAIDMLPQTAIAYFSGGQNAMAYMFANSSSQGTKSALQLGATPEQATTYGIVMGAIEVGTEMIVGGWAGVPKGKFTGIFNTGLSQPLQNAALRMAKTELGQKAVNMAFQYLGEGAEEYLSEVLGNYANAIIGQDVQSFADIQEEALYSGLVGTFTAVVMDLGRVGLVKGAEKVAQGQMEAFESMPKEEQIAYAQKVLNKSKTELVFADNFQGQEVKGAGMFTTVNGKSFVVLPTSMKDGGENILSVSLMHEYTHTLEQSGQYDKFKTNILTHLDNSGLLDVMRQTKQELYKNENLTPEDIDSEIVATFMQDNLFKRVVNVNGKFESYTDILSFKKFLKDLDYKDLNILKKGLLGFLRSHNEGTLRTEYDTLIEQYQDATKSKDLVKADAISKQLIQLTQQLDQVNPKITKALELSFNELVNDVEMNEPKNTKTNKQDSLFMLDDPKQESIMNSNEVKKAIKNFPQSIKVVDDGIELSVARVQSKDQQEGQSLRGGDYYSISATNFKEGTEDVGDTYPNSVRVSKKTIVHKPFINIQQSNVIPRTHQIVEQLFGVKKAKQFFDITDTLMSNNQMSDKNDLSMRLLTEFSDYTPDEAQRMIDAIDKSSVIGYGSMFHKTGEGLRAWKINALMDNVIFRKASELGYDSIVLFGMYDSKARLPQDIREDIAQETNKLKLDKLNKELSVAEKKWFRPDELIVLQPQGKPKFMLKDDKKLEDFGEKIGGAKKDIIRNGRITLDSVVNMNEAEMKSLITKDKVFGKIDYKKLIEDGMPDGVAHFIKVVKDSLPSSPPFNSMRTTQESVQKYIDEMNEIRAFVDTIKTKEDVFNAWNNFFVKNGYFEESNAFHGNRWTEKSGNRVAINNDLSKALRSVRNDYEYNRLVKKNSKIKGYEVNFDDQKKSYYIVKGHFIIEDGFKTEEEAIAAIQNQSKKTGDGKIKIVPPQLSSVERVGYDYRQGKNIEGQNYLDEFKFRGGEFGEWENANDRQTSLNYGYDALHDLANTLGILPESISLNGDLAIAFGSRGSGSALAHYESLRRVINLTKMKGAGSLGHEWFHALDHYLSKIAGVKDADVKLLSEYFNSLRDLNESSIKYNKMEKFPRATAMAFVGLMETIKHQTVPFTVEEQLMLIDEKNRKFIRNLKSWVSQYEYYPGAQKQIDALIKKDFDAVEKLNQIVKEKTGRMIPKDARDQIIGNMNMIRLNTSDVADLTHSVYSKFYKDAQFLDAKTTGGKMGGYWSAEQELLARSFSTYLIDKMGIRSDYLVRAVDNSLYPDEVNPFPEGEQRKEINKGFDQLFKALKEDGLLKANDKPVNIKTDRIDIISDDQGVSAELPVSKATLNDMKADDNALKPVVETKVEPKPAEVVKPTTKPTMTSDKVLKQAEDQGQYAQTGFVEPKATGKYTETAKQIVNEIFGDDTSKEDAKKIAAEIMENYQETDNTTDTTEEVEETIKEMVALEKGKEVSTKIDQYRSEFGVSPANNKDLQSHHEKTLTNMQGHGDSKIVEMVKTDDLEQFVELNRMDRPFFERHDGYDNPKDFIQALSKDILENGFKEPVVLFINADTGFTVLGEGNHRYAIARLLGIEQIPVRVLKSVGRPNNKGGAFIKLENFKGFTGGKKQVIDGVEYDIPKHLKAEMPPSDLGIASEPILKPTQAIQPVVEQTPVVEQKPVVEQPQALQGEPSEDDTKTRRVPLTTINSGVLTQEQQEDVLDDLVNGKFQYQPMNDKKALEYAEGKVNTDPNRAYQDFKSAYENNRMMTKNDIAVAERLIKHFADTNNKASLNELIGMVAEMGTSLGQQVQALSLIKKMTPAGQAMVLQKTLERLEETYRQSKYEQKTDYVLPEVQTPQIEAKQAVGDFMAEKDKVEQITPETVGEVQTSLNKIAKKHKVDPKAVEIDQELVKSLDQQTTPEDKQKVLDDIKKDSKKKLDKVIKSLGKLQKTYEGKKIDLTIDPTLKEELLNAKNQAEIDEIIEKIKVDVASRIPATLGDKVNAWRFLSMLGNPRTHIRNINGNAVMDITAKVKDKVALAIEQGFIKPEDRTKSLKINKNIKNFVNETFNKRVDEITMNGKYDMIHDIESRKQIFDTIPLEKARVWNFDKLEKADIFAMRRAFTNVLGQFMTARNYDPKTITNEQLEKAITYASEQARVRTFRQYSKTATLLNQIEKTNLFTKVLIGSLAPFKKTPINILKTGFEYSPAGLLANIPYGIVQVKKGNWTTTQFVDKIAAGLTGTGIAALGMLMSSLGILSVGDDDEKSKKENSFDSSLGKQRYSLNVGDWSVSLDWLSPAVMPLFIGAEMEMWWSAEKGGNILDESSEALANIFNPAFDLTMLQGISDAFKSFETSGANQMGDILSTMLANYTTQFVPTILSQTAKTIDPTVRSTYAGSGMSGTIDTTINKIKNKIPFVSMMNEPLINVKGQEITQVGGAYTKDVMGNIGSGVLRAIQNFLNPANIKESNANDTDTEIYKIFDKTGDTSVIPALAPSSFTYNGEKIDLQGDNKTSYAKTMGTVSYNTLDQVFKSKLYKSLGGDEVKGDVVKDALAYASLVAKSELMASNGKPFVNTTLQKMSEAEDNGVNIAEYLIMKSKLNTIESTIDFTRKEQFISDLVRQGFTDDEIYRYLVYVGDYSFTTSDQKYIDILRSVE